VQALGGSFATLVILINVAAGAVSTLLIYKLGLQVLRDQEIALLAALFFIFNPALVFHAAPYTESLFTLFTFAVAYLLYCYRSLAAATLAAALSSATRSNGERVH
jgi:Gpi18-like mannosyltransferase